MEVSKVSIGIIENTVSIISTAPVDSSGRFRLEGIDITGEASLLVSAVNKRGNPQGLILLDSLKYIPEEVPDNLPQQMVLAQENVTTFKQEYEIKESVRKKYKLSDTIDIGEVTIIAQKPKDFQTIKVDNIRTVYGKPDNEVKITTKFLGYHNVFEILAGRFAGVVVDPTSCTIHIRGRNSLNLTNTPLYLIDGVPKSTLDLVQYPVDFIDRIDVLKSAGEIGVYGARGANGVISIITKTADRSMFDQSLNKSDNHLASIKISGYDAARIFYSPQHLPSSVSAYQPDLRTTLFWKPDIRIQSDKDLVLKYFNADNRSTIRVILEGITTTGIPITARTEYEVR